MYSFSFSLSSAYQNLGVLLKNAGATSAVNPVSMQAGFFRNTSTTLKMYVASGYNTAPTELIGSVDPGAALNFDEGFNANLCWVKSVSGSPQMDFFIGSQGLITATNISGLMPGGGTTNQFLAKTSNANYNTAWFTLNQAAVAGLTTADSPTFAGLTVTTHLRFDDPNNNTSVGHAAGTANTSGSLNSSFGSNALVTNSTGFGNTAIGFNSLATTTGNANTGIGASSLAAMSSGGSNTAVGYNSASGLTTGNSNTFLGVNTGASITTGSNNTIIGANVSGLSANLINNVIIADGAGTIRAQHNGTDWTLIGTLLVNTPLRTTFVGKGAGSGNTSGTDNSFVGFQAGLLNTTGQLNTAMGSEALFNTTSGVNNTALGAFSLNTNIVGSDNVGVGKQALSNAIASQNIAIGNLTGNDVSTGTNNTFLGHNTGRGIDTGSANTVLGSNVSGLAAGLANNVIIADGAGNQRITVDSTGLVAIPLRGLQLPSLADSAAANSSLYFSTTATKLVWKDSGGVVHALY